MMTAEQQKLLNAPLNRANVRTRVQSGREFSYIEGWHAISEANRIFGFDGWSRETVEIKCVSEKERPIGQAKFPGWGVTYICKVKINVHGIVREGCGTGHGIDRDLGQAHESALKEAETDGMKRALMTFGNQFGLALYDKEQTNVCDKNDENHEAGKVLKNTDVQALDLRRNLSNELIEIDTEIGLKDWMKKTTTLSRIAMLPINWQDDLRVQCHDKLIAFKETGNAP